MEVLGAPPFSPQETNKQLIEAETPTNLVSARFKPKKVTNNNNTNNNFSFFPENGLFSGKNQTEKKTNVPLCYVPESKSKRGNGPSS